MSNKERSYKNKGMSLKPSKSIQGRRDSDNGDYYPLGQKIQVRHIMMGIKHLNKIHKLRVSKPRWLAETELNPNKHKILEFREIAGKSKPKKSSEIKIQENIKKRQSNKDASQTSIVNLQFGDPQKKSPLLNIRQKRDISILNQQRFLKSQIEFYSYRDKLGLVGSIGIGRMKHNLHKRKLKRSIKNHGRSYSRSLRSKKSDNENEKSKKRTNKKSIKVYFCQKDLSLRILDEDKDCSQMSDQNISMEQYQEHRSRRCQSAFTRNLQSEKDIIGVSPFGRDSVPDMGMINHFSESEAHSKSFNQTVNGSRYTRRKRVRRKNTSKQEDDNTSKTGQSYIFQKTRILRSSNRNNKTYAKCIQSGKTVNKKIRKFSVNLKKDIRNNSHFLGKIKRNNFSIVSQND